MYFSKNDIIMNIFGKTIIFFIFLLFSSCANYETNKSMQKEEKKYYTSTGFALIFDDEFYEQGIINKKINNDQIAVMHSFLKKNTPIEIMNPDSLNTIETKVTINTNYPKIFNVVISKKIAMILDIDYENPYVINHLWIGEKVGLFWAQLYEVGTVYAQIEQSFVMRTTSQIKFTLGG